MPNFFNFHVNIVIENISTYSLNFFIYHTQIPEKLPLRKQLTQTLIDLRENHGGSILLNRTVELIWLKTIKQLT
jgi:hypothetical protein